MAVSILIVDDEADVAALFRQHFRSLIFDADGNGRSDPLAKRTNQFAGRAAATSTGATR
jgi:hypothetical protein